MTTEIPYIMKLILRAITAALDERKAVVGGHVHTDAWVRTHKPSSYMGQSVSVLFMSNM